MRTIVPTPAAAVGYNLRTFGPELIFGENWFACNFWLNPPPGALIASQNEDGSLIVTGQHHYGISTATRNPGAPATWKGAAFGGGAYIEALIAFQTQAQAKQPWPGFWGHDIESLCPLAGKGIEHDYMEADGGSAAAYGCGMHDWWDVLGSQNQTNTTFAANPTTPEVMTSGLFNRFGWLWVPAKAGVRGSGYVQFYFNGRLQRTQAWDPYVANQPTPTVLGASAGNVTDVRHHMPMFSCGIDCPITVKSMSVWQASDAGNLRQ